MNPRVIGKAKDRFLECAGVMAHGSGQFSVPQRRQLGAYPL
jgi:hypothetical protein